MPFAEFKSIREVSNEDKVHCAANLLDGSGRKKWKTEAPGEKSAYVIIEMKKPYLIKGIDIGNENSAFVEVSVGDPGCPREKFQDILITSSFMTPIESRLGTNPNRVRCFNREVLVKETACKKWNLLKVVCSQPFNDNVQYGLSFIKVHVEVQEEVVKPSNGMNISFSLREDSPDSESESANALFQRWKASHKKETSTTCSVPREPTLAALKKPDNGITLNKQSIVGTRTGDETAGPSRHVPDRNRDSLLYTDEDDKVATEVKKKKRLAMLEKIISADQERVSKEAEKHKKASPKKNTKTDPKPENKTPKKQSPKNSPAKAKKQATPSTSNQKRLSPPAGSSSKAKKLKLQKIVEYRPFHQLLRDVILVISGIQNPARSELRNKALALGAKYKQDWDSSCTHLICAFKNTPKYNQVKGVGKIVTRKWIDDCYTSGKHIPWRRYALDDSEGEKSESEDEILDEAQRPRDNPSTSQSKPETEKRDDEEDNAIYDSSKTNQLHCVTSDSDTEDELQKVLASTSRKPETPSKTVDIYEASTEEEDYVTKRKLSAEQAQFFKDCVFFVSDQLSAVEKVKIERYITGFKGTLTKSIDEAKYVIADEPVAHSGQFKGETVKPLWVAECYESEMLIPTSRYLVT